MSVEAFNIALARAYETHQVQRQPVFAVESIREIISDPAMRAAAKAKRDHLAAIVAARTMGNVCGCHVSKIQHEILSAALQESLNG